MKYISLFAGIGGFDLALNRLGHVCVWANEWDKYAAQIYNKNFGQFGERTRGTECLRPFGDSSDSPGEPRESYKDIDTRDITTVATSEIPDHELLVGGFPCQAFSIAGKRKGFDDTRGTLFFEIARILRDKRPKYFILENVKGLLSHDSGKTFATILGVLTDLGYDFQWQVLNSKNFGVPQNRERVFIVGHIRGQPRPEVFPIAGSNEENNGLVYHQKADREIARVYDTKGIAPTLHLKTGGWQEPKIAMALDANYYKGLSPSHSKNRVDRNIIAYSSSQRKDHIEHRIKEGEANCLTTGKGCAGGMKSMSFVKEDLKIRRLTPTECERLQGFPDGWTEGISDTQRYKCLGNAVTVNVVQAIAERLTHEN